MAKTKDTIVRILHVIKKEKDPMFEIPKRSQKKIAVADAFSESGYCEHNNDRWLRNSNDGTKPAAAAAPEAHGEVAVGRTIGENTPVECVTFAGLAAAAAAVAAKKSKAKIKKDKARQNQATWAVSAKYTKATQIPSEAVSRSGRFIC